MKTSNILRLFAAFALLSANLSYAEEADFGCMLNKPKRCPTATEIRDGKVGAGVIYMNGQFYAGRRHLPYGTDNVWTFIMGPIPAASKDDAYSSALNNLPTLSFLFGPVCSPLHNWMCVYNTRHGVPAVVATPQLPTLQAATGIL